MIILATTAWTDTTWTFTSWSNGTKTALSTDAATNENAGTLWGVDATDQYGYKPSKANTAAADNVVLQTNNGSGANDITELAGLTFNYPKSDKYRIKIITTNNANSLFFVSANEKVNVPVSAGKKVTISSSSYSSNNNRIECETSGVVAYNQTDASSGSRTDAFIVTSNVTTATFKGIEGHGIYLYSIIVSDATAEELLSARFGTDNYVTATTVWTFDDLSDNTITELNHNGLYMKSHSNTKPNTVELLSNDNAGGYDAPKKYCSVKGAGSLTAANLQTSKASDYKTDCMAINIAKSGTLYAKVSAGGTDRSVSIYKGNSASNTGSETLSDLILTGATATISSKNTIYEVTATITEPGTYWITGTNAYYVNAVKFVPDLITINPTVSLTGWTYGEAANTTPTVEGNTGNGVVTYQYKLATADDEAYTTFDADHYPTAVGEYNIKANIAANGDYAEGSAVSTFTIAKAAGAVSFTTATPEQTLSATPAENTYTQAATVTGDAVPSYALSNNTCEATIEGAVVTFTQAGSVTVTATVADTDNYAYTTKTASYTLTINNAAITGITVTPYNTAYDGNAHGITVTCEGATIKYGETEGSYTLDASPTITNVSESPKTVYYKVSKDNYADVTGSSTITITPKDLTITAKPQTITQGENISPGVDQVEVSGLVDGDALTAITLTPSTSEVTTTGTIKPSEAETTKGATNYKITYNTGNLTINSAPSGNPTLTITQPNTGGTISADPSGEIASGKQVIITITPSLGYQLKSGTLNYSYNDGEDHVVAINEETKTFEMPAYAINLTAEFEPITFTIAYYGLEGANLSGMNPESYTVETDAFTLINPTMDNAEFAGWTGTELNAASTSVTISKGSTGNREYTATWTENTPAEEPTISTSMLWTFEDLTGTISSHTLVKESAYLRACPRPNNNDDRQFVVAEATGSVTFDGIEVPYTKKVTASEKMVGTSSTSFTTDATAGMTSPSVLLPSFAFNTDVAGTVYVAMKSTVTSGKGQRIYFNDGTEAKVVKQVTATGEIDVISYTSSKAGSFFIGDVQGAYELYAVKFVPTSASPTAYDITVNQPTGGTIGVKVGDAEVTTDNTTATSGQTITLSNTPADNYAFTSYSVTKTVGGDAITVTNGSFTMPAEAVTVTAVFESTAHVHSFIYEVGSGENANILTATCKNANCSLPENKATLTLTATGGTYNGSPFGASTDLDAFNSATGLSATCTINYTGSDSYNSSDAPTNAGSYTATATVTIGGTDYILTKAFSISSVSDPTFNIQLPELDNGNNVLASHAYATAGTEITLTIVTATNYCLSSISVNNGVKLSGSGAIRNFYMPASDVTISATFIEVTAENVGKQVTENVTIDNDNHATVTSVEIGASTTSVTISSSVDGVPVTSIADNAFSNVADKDDIKSIDLSATSITGVEVNRESGVFSGFPEETMIYMPTGNTADGQKNVVIGETCADFEMVNEKSYNIPTPFTATKATLSRSFTSNVYCTLCLPYAIPAGNLGGKIYEFTSIEGTTVQMTEDTDGLDANKPYIFVPSAAAEGISASNVEVNMSSTPNTENNTSNFTFKGVYEHKEFTSTEISSGVYGFAADTEHGASSVGQFVKAANGAWIEGMRAYLAYNGSLSETGVAATRGEGLPDVLNVVLIHANGSTTNIGRLELMTAEDGSPVYNLNGQRVDNSYKGLVIKNGKKVVKK